MRKLFFLICITSLLSNFSFAQHEKAQKYIAMYKQAAIAEMQRSGVPASITLAQGMLESGFGESELCKKSNNHFGIKCKNDWTGEKAYHDDDEKQECFRAYTTAADSYKDHSDFLRSRPWYAFLFKLDATDYEGWAKGLKKAGYATEKDYPVKLIHVINDNNLQQYTLAGLQKPENKDAVEQVTTIVETNTQPIPIDAIIEKEELIDSETVINPIKQIDATAKQPTNYPEGVFTINHAKVIYAKEGMSLLSLANQFNITLSNLFVFNSLKEMDVLDADRLIFVGNKLKKGATDFHIVQPGETLNSISQTQGVQLESILLYNKLDKLATIKSNDKIYLRSPNTKTAK